MVLLASDFLSVITSVFLRRRSLYFYGTPALSMKNRLA